jgi:hypothetical protein
MRRTLSSGTSESSCGIVCVPARKIEPKSGRTYIDVQGSCLYRTQHLYTLHDELPQNQAGEYLAVYSIEFYDTISEEMHHRHLQQLDVEVKALG